MKDDDKEEEVEKLELELTLAGQKNTKLTKNNRELQE